MQYFKTTGFSVVALLIVLSVSAGVALAMQSESCSVPSGDEFRVEAELTAADVGAEVYGVRENEPDTGASEVEFSVGFGSDGYIVVNGTSGPAYEETGIYLVVVDAAEDGGQWTADIRIIDNVSGDTVFVQQDFVLDAKPDTVVAEGASIARLIVTP